MIEPTTAVAGIQVAGIGDLWATKLNVIVHRPEARDYFDLMTIEQQAHRYVEEGLALFVQRYRPAAPEQALTTIVRALAYSGDVAEDRALPVDLDAIERYWQSRVPEVVAHLDRDR